MTVPMEIWSPSEEAICLEGIIFVLKSGMLAIVSSTAVARSDSQKVSAIYTNIHCRRF